MSSNAMEERHKQVREEKYRNIAATYTFRPLPHSILSQDSLSDESKSKKAARRDGRRKNEFRPFYMKTGVIGQASGSAYLEMNKTKIICSVYGPHQSSKMEFSEKAKLQCEFKFATFSEQKERKKYTQDKEEKEFSMLMVQSLESSLILEKYPKSVIDCYVLVLENDGGALSGAITCASLALANAGIEMFDLVAATTAGVDPISGDIILDPTEEEGRKKGNGTGGVVTIAYMTGLNEVTQIWQSGEMTYENAKEGIDLCIDGCSRVVGMMRSAILPKQKPQTKT